MDAIGRGDAAGAGDVRVRHPLRLREGPTGVGAGRGPHMGVAIDVASVARSRPDGDQGTTFDPAIASS